MTERDEEERRNIVRYWASIGVGALWFFLIMLRFDQLEQDDRNAVMTCVDFTAARTK